MNLEQPFSLISHCFEFVFQVPGVHARGERAIGRVRTSALTWTVMVFTDKMKFGNSFLMGARV